MEKYKIIRFESLPIRIKRNNDLAFLPQYKCWNKIHEICKTYAKAMKYFPEHTDIKMFIDSMNTPALLRGTGLKYLNRLNLAGREYVELDYIFPAGRIEGKTIHAEYVKVSKEYVLLDRQKLDERFDILKIIKKNRLDAWLKGSRVRIYDLKFETDEFKII